MEESKRIKKTKGLRQETLALLCDLDRSYICDFERGKRNITLINIHKFAIALNINTKELLGANNV